MLNVYSYYSKIHVLLEKFLKPFLVFKKVHLVIMIHNKNIFIQLNKIYFFMS